MVQNLEEPFQAARYHSLVIDQESFPDQALEITARTADGTIMAVRHRDFPLLQAIASTLHADVCTFVVVRLSFASQISAFMFIAT